MSNGAKNYFVGFFFFKLGNPHSCLTCSPLALSLALCLCVYLSSKSGFFRTGCEFFILSHRHMTMGEEGCVFLKYQ